MRKAIWAFATLAIVAAAQPAVAIDDGFRGRYRLIAHDVSGVCRNDSYRRPVHVRFISGRVRQLSRPGSDTAMRFRYETSLRGLRFPWRHTRGNRFVLRYDMFTGRAVGFRQGVQKCKWRVHLVPID